MRVVGLGQIALVDPASSMRMLEQRNNQRKEDERDRITYGSLAPFLTHAEPDDLEELAGNHAIYVGELSRGHTLYTPAAMIAGEAVEELDHVGLNLSLLMVGPDREGDAMGVQTLRSMQMEAKEGGKKSDALDEILASFDNKISEMKAQAQQKAEAEAQQKAQTEAQQKAQAEAQQQLSSAEQRPEKDENEKKGQDGDGEKQGSN
eukprot:Skav225296  [mRNA]  locus=scaffold4099:489897:490511:- [translate_table: standard]